MNKLNTITLSVAVLSAMALNGCGGDSSTPSNQAPGTILSSKVDGKVVDGYIYGSTVCLDLNMDGICQHRSEPSDTSDMEGSFTLNFTEEHKAHANFIKAPILSIGGFDVDTNFPLEGTLKTTFDGEKNIANLSPVTTLVQIMIDEEDISETEAKEKVRTMFGLSGHIEVDDDPVALAKNNEMELFIASLQIHKSLESMVETNTTMETLYRNLAQAMINTDIDDDFDDFLREDMNAIQAATLAEALGASTAGSNDIKRLALAIEILVEMHDDDDDYDDKSQFTLAQLLEKSTKELKVIQLAYELDVYEYPERVARIKNVVDTMAEDKIFSNTGTLLILENLKADGCTSDELDDLIEDIKETIEEIKESKLLINAGNIAWNVPFVLYKLDGDDDDREVKVISFSADNTLTYEEYEDDKKTGRFEFDASSSDVKQFTLSSDNIVLELDSTKKIIAKEIDLSNSTNSGYADIIEKLREDFSIINVSFDSGSKAYILAEKDDDDSSFDIEDEIFLNKEAFDSLGITLER